MREPMMEFPSEDAPIEEWGRPVSGTMLNGERTPPDCEAEKTKAGAAGGHAIKNKRKIRYRAPLTDEERETIRQMAMAGCTIAERVQVGRGCARETMKKLGIYEEWKATRGRT